MPEAIFLGTLKITLFLAISDVAEKKSMYDYLQIKGFPMQYFWTPELSILARNRVLK